MAALLVVLALGSEASALTVTNSVAKLAGNSADDTTWPTAVGNSGNYSSSTVTTLVSPGGTIPDAFGATRTFTTRYSALLVADSDQNGSSNSQTTGTFTASYRISFSVTAGVGVKYTIYVTEKMLGELTAVEDGQGIGNGTISNVTGTFSGGGVQSGTLALATGASNTSPAVSAGPDADVTISKNGTLQVTGLIGTGAVQNFTVDFTWTMSASSTTSGNAQGDEAAVRLGQPALTTLFGTTAGDYPGGTADVPTRSATCTTTAPDFGGCDGHLVTVTVTEAPLPASLSLLGFGLVTGAGGLWLRRWRRR